MPDLSGLNSKSARALSLSLSLRVGQARVVELPVDDAEELTMDSRSGSSGRRRSAPPDDGAHDD